MHGSMITFPSPAGLTPGYLSLPEHRTGSGVVVIQEWWGLVDHIKDIADRFADAGFVALAPDLYHGETTKSPDDAQKRLMALNIANAGAEIHAAVQYLLSTPNISPREVGVIGFCMGGQLALYAATEYPDSIRACVDFYGIHPNAIIDPKKLQVPVLAHFGNEDSLVKHGNAQALVQKISDAGKFIDAYYYDTGHAFFNNTRPEAYNGEAAALAWSRTLAFFRDTLR
jgi:carboxymethylenebutenolidase